MSDTYDLAPDESSGSSAGAVRGSAGTVTGSVGCVRCGYDLKGLPTNGPCPECGLPVGRSLLGSDLLVHSDHAFVSKLHLGSIIVLTAISVWMVLFILTIVWRIVTGVLGMTVAVNPDVVEFMSQAIDALLSLAAIGGWWLLSERDPSFVGTDVGSKSRLVLRGGLIASTVGTLLALVAQGMVALSPRAFSDLYEVAGLVALVAWAVRFFASMVYVRWLARRIPDEFAERRAGMLMWAGPLLMTVGACLLVGPLIALVLYWNLINWVRRDLRRILDKQERWGQV